MTPRSEPADQVPLGLRERGKRRRTERILDAALELLREDPDQHLTVERIAERAEVAPMTVYNLVGTRDEMWRAVGARALPELPVASPPPAQPQGRASPSH